MAPVCCARPRPGSWCSLGGQRTAPTGPGPAAAPGRAAGPQASPRRSADHLAHAPAAWSAPPPDAGAVARSFHHLASQGWRRAVEDGDRPMAAATSAPRPADISKQPRCGVSTIPSPGSRRAPHIGAVIAHARQRRAQATAAGNARAAAMPGMGHGRRTCGKRPACRRVVVLAAAGR